MERDPAKDLQGDIEKTWGPYSIQALTYRSILKQLEAAQNSHPALPPAPVPTAPITLESYPSQDFISKSTLTFYLTRTLFIIGVWVLALAGIIVMATMGYFFLF
tara:strand:- start:789 stop:1100 length:312 start_codon:yes stop_codon:yes gene_type:complete